ncbi:PIG-L deacetylase family protein [Luteibacter sp.]|uniref:PIG-L deacetylase family protein n=1 Tax=Luteibacter sp. TaxID=1886636 RepID=UPI003F8045A5
MVAPIAVLRTRPLMVVAPHPDDESLGLGGLIAAARALNLPVTVVFLTDGERSHVGSPTWPARRLAAHRRLEAVAALGELGVAGASAHFLGLGDTRLHALDGAAQATAQAKLATLAAPNTLVCVTAATDPHSDHQAAAALVDRVPWAAGVEIMHYPVWTWTRRDADLPITPLRGVRIDVATHLPRKRAAIAAHRTQHGELIHDAAEAFVLDSAFLARFAAPTETLIWPR